MTGSLLHYWGPPDGVVRSGFSWRLRYSDHDVMCVWRDSPWLWRCYRLHLLCCHCTAARLPRGYKQILGHSWVPSLGRGRGRQWLASMWRFNLAEDFMLERLPKTAVNSCRGKCKRAYSGLEGSAFATLEQQGSWHSLRIRDQQVRNTLHSTPVLLGRRVCRSFAAAGN